MYADFEVRIQEADAPGPYRVEVIASLAEPADGEMVLPTGFGLLLSTVRQDSADLIARQEFGTKLFQALFCGEVARAWYETKGQSRGQRQDGLRLLLRIDDPYLARFPWELLHDGRSFLATSASLPVSRYLPSDTDPLVLDSKSKLRVLAVLESPKGMTPITAEFRQAFNESLRQLKEAVEVESVVLENASLKEISKSLSDGYHVLHLVAHGDDSGQIALVDDDHTSMRRINDKEFAQLFQGRRVRLVVLSACGSAGGVDGGLFLGVGPSLVRIGVPAVIAMQYPFVRQASAGVFNTAFYESLAKNRPVDVAVNEGRQLLSSDRNLEERDWSTPVLFMGTRTGQIVSLRRISVRRAATLPRVESPEAPTPANEDPAEVTITKRIRILMPLDPKVASRNGVLALVYKRLKTILEEKINASPLVVSGRTYRFEVGVALPSSPDLPADELLGIRDADIVIGYVCDLNLAAISELVARTLLRPELILVIDGDGGSLLPPLLRELRDDLKVPLARSWVNDPVLQKRAPVADHFTEVDFETATFGAYLREYAAEDDRLVEGEIRRALQRVLAEGLERPEPAVRLMQDRDPQSLVSTSSFFYPAAVARFTWLPRKRNLAGRYSPPTLADLSDPPIYCDWNSKLLDLFGREDRRPGEDGFLLGEEFDPFLMANMDPEDYASFRRDQFQLIENIVLADRDGVASVPIHFNFNHPNAWYRNRSFLPCYVMKKWIGDRGMMHFLYLLVVFFDVTDAEDYRVFQSGGPDQHDRSAHRT